MTPRHVCDMRIDCALTPRASDPAEGCGVCKNCGVRAQQGSGGEDMEATIPVAWLRWGIKWGPHEVNEAPII